MGRAVRRAFHGKLSTGRLSWAALQTDEANLIDLIKFGQGNRFSLDHLWDEFRAFDIDDRLTAFETPLVFMLGRDDWQVPSVLAARYFERIHAPHKRLVWFERSAHHPPFEEPELFNRTVVDALRPLVVCNGCRSVSPEIEHRIRRPVRGPRIFFVSSAAQEDSCELFAHS